MSGQYRRLGEANGDGALVRMELAPRSVAVTLGVVVVGLALGHCAVHTVAFLYDLTSEQMFGLRRFFDFAKEANPAAYFSALCLLGAAALLAIIARMTSVRGGRFVRHWWGLALGFLIMSLDEAAMIHDGLIAVALDQFMARGEGIAYFSWYKVYLPLVLVIGAIYVPFLLALPRSYASRMLLAGGVYVGGAIGFEMVESVMTYNRMRGLSVGRLFEETCEMFGTILFIHVLLGYLGDQRASLVVGFRKSRTRQAPIR